MDIEPEARLWIVLCVPFAPDLPASPACTDRGLDFPSDDPMSQIIGKPRHRRSGDMIALRESATLELYVGKGRHMSNQQPATARLPKPGSQPKPQPPVRFDDWAAI